VALGFRRLSIIAPDAGRQPLSNEDRSVWTVMNGEIYNYRELRSELKGRGHVFRTGSDAEVLVHLYEEHGDRLTSRLRGMFAFAIWDRNRARLLLARDHFGQKPLFWAWDRARLLFASEIKAILAAAPRFRTVDPAALHEYFSYRIISDPRSMFAGVNKLPPGHVLTASAGEHRIERYWNLRFEPKASFSEDEALARLDGLVRESVRYHMVSDVPVGSFLSGGLDSGIVTAIASDLQKGALPTFTASVPHSRFDEAPVARDMSARFGTEHHEAVVGADALDLLPEVVQHMDEPSDALGVGIYRLASLVREQVKVVLGGDGGDEIFGGYDRYAGVPFVRYYAMLPRAMRKALARRWTERPAEERWYKSVSNRIRWMDHLADEDEGRRYARSLNYFYFTPEHVEALYTEDFRAAVSGSSPGEAIVRWYEEGGADRMLDRMLLSDCMVRLPNHPLMILDRMTMAHGVEARSPFLDVPLAEFMASLPTRMKVRGGRRRYLQMKLARRYLPASVLSRPKQGFTSGLPYLAGREIEMLLSHFLSSSSMVEAGYLRRPPVEAMLREHLSGRRDHANRLWLLLNAELWYRIHIDGHHAVELREEIRDLRCGMPPRALTTSVRR